MKALLSLPSAQPTSRAEDDAYVSYSYSYPHKSAYGPLKPAVALEPLWQAQRRDALFLYVHVPFCEMRCGFCNLFARAGAEENVFDAYLAALQRQFQALAHATAGGRAVSRLALGGGTPTLLSPARLEFVFELAERHFNARPSCIPTSVEASPQTATPERLEVLRRWGIERVSIGVQSFIEAETQAIGRPQKTREVHAALDRLRDFSVLNIDLIYGQPGQTPASWLASVQTALEYGPEEIYLYPLYVRPRTGIGRRGGAGRAPDSLMRFLYREARALLLAEGYEQISMRFFQVKHTPPSAGPIYCCQTDAMLGLGCGARSYTSRLHYSSRFAVEAAGVQAILSDWIKQTSADFLSATWGVRLSDDDCRRRFVIQSLLTRAGLEEAAYRRLFGAAPQAAFPELLTLVERGMAERDTGSWRLTDLGLELSDLIGPALYAPSRRTSLEEFGRRREI